MIAEIFCRVKVDGVLRYCFFTYSEAWSDRLCWIAPAVTQKEHSWKKRSRASTHSTQNPEAAVQMMGGHFHGRECSWTVQPAVQMTEGVVLNCSAGGNLQKESIFLVWIFARLDWSWSSPGPLTRCACLDGPSERSLGLLRDLSNMPVLPGPECSRAGAFHRTQTPPKTTSNASTNGDEPK